MIWFKNRDSNATPRGNWYVYHKDLANANGYVFLNSSSAEATDYPGWSTGTFAPSATGFTVLKDTLHYTNEKYVAYFFATVAGVSKVGSITGNGSTSGDDQNIDCGFTNGAKFVLIRRLSGPGGWYLFDTTQGITSGNDPFAALNNNNAQTTNVDLIDTLSSGFVFNYNSDWSFNLDGNTYLFYAIANDPL